MLKFSMADSEDGENPIYIRSARLSPALSASKQTSDWQGGFQPFLNITPSSTISTAGQQGSEGMPVLKPKGLASCSPGFAEPWDSNEGGGSTKDEPQRGSVHRAMTDGTALRFGGGKGVIGSGDPR